MRKKIQGIIVCLVLSLLLTGCGRGAEPKQTISGGNDLGKTAAEVQQDESKEVQQDDQNVSGQKKQQEYQFQDDLGYTVCVRSADRVAAIGGSNAETWLLAGGTLAALTEDAYSERGIEPREDVTNLGTVRSPDIETMILLDIDFVILNAKIAEHVALRSALESAGMTTAYFEVETFDDYLEMLGLCTDMTGRKDLYEKNGLAVWEQIDEVLAGVKGKAAPSVLFLRAYSTGITVKGSDSMTGAMLKDLGCRNIADSDTGLLENLSMEAIIQEDPDFILVTTQGASPEAAQKELEETLQSNPAWKELSAVKNGNYHLLPQNLFHYKPNDRWGESYEMLAEILYGKE